MRDVKPLYRPIYNLLVNEFSILRDNLEEFLKKKYIQRLSSPADTSILFISKKNGGLRMCVNYRELNKIIKKKSTLTSLYRKNAGSILKNSNIYEAKCPRYLLQNKD